MPFRGNATVRLQRYHAGSTVLSEVERADMVELAYRRAHKSRGCDLRHLAVALGYRICPVDHLAELAVLDGDRLDYLWTGGAPDQCGACVAYGVACGLLVMTQAANSEPDRHAVAHELILSRRDAMTRGLPEILKEYRNAPRAYLEAAWLAYRGSGFRAKKIV